MLPNQGAGIGMEIIVTPVEGGTPFLTTLSGRGRKDGQMIYEYNDGANWAFPTEVDAIPPAMSKYMGAIYNALGDKYPEALSDENKGKIYKDVRGKFQNFCADGYGDLFNAVENAAQRVETSVSQQMSM